METDETAFADFRNGQDFVGSSFSYLPNRSTRFDMIVDGVTTPVPARAGDTPAFQVTAPDHDALMVVVSEAATSTVTYKEWEKFLAFAKHKDFPTAGEDHIAWGWPQDRFKESYTRHVKALIAVGDGRGADAATGMETEFVALTNPYDAEFDGMMRVQLLYQGAPRPDAQIEVFDRAPDDSVTVTMHRTDAAGIGAIPVTSGHEYLFDAVVLRPVPDVGRGDAVDANKPIWRTLWAALTFAVPQ